MYLHPNDTVYTTLALGEAYRRHAETLCQSVLKFTHNDIYVITDKPSHFDKWYGPRAHFVQFDKTLTDLPMVHKDEVFNYNLKMVPMKYCFEQVRTQLVIYIDADTFLFGPQESTMHRYFTETGIYGRLRHKLNESIGQHVLIEQKLKQMGIDVTNIETRMPVECVLFMSQGDWSSKFFDEWYKYAMISYETGCTAFYEATEMTLALHAANVPMYHLDNRHPFTEAFRTIHGGDKNPYLHSPFVL